MSKFAQITQKDVSLLMKKKASATAISVYLCLVAHAHHPKDHCKPSIENIRSWIGKTVQIRQIHKCLKFLSEQGLIIRNGKDREDRFVIVSRRKMKATRMSKVNVSSQDSMNMCSVSSQDVDRVSRGHKIGSPEDAIKENKKRELKDHSISNEDKKESSDVEKWILKDKIESDPLFHAQCVVGRYEEYSQLTGNVFSEQERRVISNQLKLEASESHKRELIRVTIANWLKNPFRKKTK